MMFMNFLAILYGSGRVSNILSRVGSGQVKVKK